MEVSLKSLVNRVKQDEEILEGHPENRDMLNMRILETKELIIQCVIQNKDNSLLDNIVMK